MEIDRRKNFRFSEWAPGSGTPNSGDTDSEGTETPILGISSSELHKEFFNAVIRHMPNTNIRGTLVEGLYGEEVYLIDGLPYHGEKNTSALTIVDRNHIYLILQECHDCPYLGHMSEDRAKERVASTAWWPEWEQEENAVEVKLTEEFSRKHPVFPVSLVKPYFQTEEDKFHSRKKNPTPQEIVEVEDSPGPVRKIIKVRKIRLNGKDQRPYLLRFKNQKADKDKWLAEDAIPDGNLHSRRFRASRRTEKSHQ
ncbi:hypothetical protein O181_050831 [Austropuccinia psidii MF-1]|uniref:Integrase zinc-binding domain-containing protein n=1 Tax=Austropuccinia psidii MF-1 TaxID=1389203 RepID=A0A9Q3E2J5_9BASI|nr:hypothetical protein [Austropuccinia psidii MF-1]